MSNSWLISIVLTLYNKAPYIEETLFSIYNQSYKNRELIIIDDCSTDWSFKIAKSFCEKLGIVHKCKFVQNDKNLRVAKSFENWLKIAEWERISMCDWDDILVKNHLEEKIEFCKKYNYEFCCGWCIDIDENNNFIGFWNKWLFWKIHKIYLKNRTYKETLILPNAIWSAIFFNKKVRDKLLEISFPIDVFQDFWTEIIATIHNFKTWTINEYLFYHRRCINSITVYKDWLLHSYKEYYKQRLSVAVYLKNRRNAWNDNKEWIKRRSSINKELLVCSTNWNKEDYIRTFFQILKVKIWFKHKCILLYQLFNIVIHK